MLDNDNLISIKAKLGVAESIKTNTTTMYLVSKKLERELKEKVQRCFEYPIDLNIFIDKVTEKLNTVEICETVREYLANTSPEDFVTEANKIKSFIIKMKKMTKEPTEGNLHITDLEDFEEPGLLSPEPPKKIDLDVILDDDDE